MTHQCRITVLRREFYPDLARAELVNPEVGKCGLFEEGRVFLVDRHNFDSFAEQHSFCASAWDTVKPFVRKTLRGENPYRVGWSRDPSKLVLCCNDGIRPVIFKLERLDLED